MGSNGRVEIVEISPEMAESWLGKNLENRNIRKGVVERYAGDMIAGNWRDTDAMFTVREDGGLLDGQHRLRAIVLSGRTVRGIVHIVNDDVRPMDLRVDTGVSRRASEILGISTNIAAASRTLYIIATRRSDLGGTPDAIGPVAARILPEFERLTTSTRRGFSTSPVVAAVCLRMWLHPSDSMEIASQYHSLVLDDRDRDVWPAFHSVSKQLVIASFRGKRSMIDSFLRVAKALDPEFRHIRNVAFKDPEVYRSKIQPIVCQYIGLPSSLPPIERA